MPEPRQEYPHPDEIIPLTGPQVAAEIDSRNTPENETAEMIVRGTTKQQLQAVVGELKSIGANHLAQLAETLTTAAAKELTNRVPGLDKGLGKGLKDLAINNVTHSLVEHPPQKSALVEKANVTIDRLSAAAGVFVPGAELVGAAVKGNLVVIDTTLQQARVMGEALKIVGESPELKAVKDRIGGMKTKAAGKAAEVFKKLPFNRSN
jgi:hypothetical protein